MLQFLELLSLQVTGSADDRSEFVTGAALEYALVNGISQYVPEFTRDVYSMVPVYNELLR